ncbi:MAG: insulinase family protein [Alphaproteobacteria bacterium]|nr:MAG: insulinase family protein [Alphaproteobacteria bacterium]
MAVRVTRLANGLTVATDAMPGLQTAALGVWVQAGARCEELHHLGVSHFLEHMAFKGTSSRSAREVVECIENVGGYLNAYTSREQTAYYARVLKDDIPLAVDVLSDILQNATLEENEIERERSVITQEIGQCIDSPEEYVFDALQEAAFPDQPMGRPILGTVETVSNMTRSHLTDYIANHYGPSTMYLVASGAVDHETICEWAEKSFSGLSDVRSGTNPLPGQWQGQSFLENRNLEQAHLSIGLPGVSVHDPDFFTAQIFSEILGGSMSSRLFQEVREKRGLCYSIYSYNTSYEDCGLFSLYAGTGGESLEEIVPVMVGELEGMAIEIHPEEVQRARAQAKAGILMGLENPQSRCEWMAKHLPRFGRVQSAEEMVAQIEAVDVANLKAFATRLMETNAPALAAIGPIERLESYDQFAARFKPAH